MKRDLSGFVSSRNTTFSERLHFTNPLFCIKLGLINSRRNKMADIEPDQSSSVPRQCLPPSQRISARAANSLTKQMLLRRESKSNGIPPKDWEPAMRRARSHSVLGYCCAFGRKERSLRNDSGLKCCTHLEPRETNFLTTALRSTSSVNLMQLIQERDLGR